MTTLPVDCTLLPLFNGALLVSPSHALFCPILPDQISFIDQKLRQQIPVSIDDLDERLKLTLKTHGFFSRITRRSNLLPKIQIQLTNACNLSCSYCCTNSRYARTDELNETELLNILQEIRKRLGKGTHVSFLGGEPFLIPFSVRLARQALALELKLTVFSNGLVLAGDDTMTKEVAALTKQGVLLRVSLAGSSQKSCDNLSGDKRFELVIAALHNLAKYGGNACVDVMLMPQNAAELAVSFHNLKKRLPNNFKISLGILYLSGREKGEHLFESRQLMEQALTDIAFESGEIIEAATPQPTMNRRDGCDCAVGMSLNIRSDGSLFPCFKMEERFGNIRELNVSEALKYLQENPHPASALKTCRQCALNTLCGGGCRSDNFLYTGSGEPLCGPWRVRVLCELLAQDCVSAVHWPLQHLHAEAIRRGIDAPAKLQAVHPSRHCIDI